jgi:hypothetical protein
MPFYHDKKYISSHLFLAIGFGLVLLVIASPSTSMIGHTPSANSNYLIIQNVLANSNDDKNQNPTPIDPDSALMSEKTVIEDTENSTNKTEEEPIIDCTQNDEKLCKNDKGSKQKVTEETEENKNNPDELSSSNQTETLPTIDTSNVPKNDTNKKLRIPVKQGDIKVYVAGNFPEEGSISDCISRAFMATNAKQEAEDCRFGQKPDQVPGSPSKGNAALDAIDQMIAAGSRNGGGDTSVCGQKEDPRGDNPYAEGDEKKPPVTNNGVKGKTIPATEKDKNGNTNEKWLTRSPNTKNVIYTSDADGNPKADETGEIRYFKRDQSEGSNVYYEVDENGKPKLDANNDASYIKLQNDTDSWKIVHHEQFKLEPLTKKGSKRTGGKPVDDSQDSQEICKNFQQLVKNCEGKEVTTKECAQITKGCEGFDPTIALTDGDYSCKEEKVDPKKVKAIATLICMQDKHPVEGEDPCKPKITGDPCQTPDDKKYTTPSVPSTGNTKGLGSCITAKSFDPCSSTIALRDEPCPITEITLPFSDLGQPGVCIPDEVTGIPKPCTSTDNNPGPQPKGPQPEPTPKLQGSDAEIGDNLIEIDPRDNLNQPGNDQAQDGQRPEPPA